MKITSTKLIAVATAILMASTSAFAAVKNGASLKGNEYTKGGNNFLFEYLIHVFATQAFQLLVDEMVAVYWCSG